MKRTVAVFVMIIMILLLSAVPALAEDAPVGIIGAMESEVSMILDSMENAGMEEISGMQFWSGTIHGCPAVLVQCGVGKVNAAMAAQTLAVHYGACAIINTGVAGALDERLNVGDLVISTDAVQHDMDVTPLGYEKGEVPYIGYTAFSADEDLISRAAASAEKVIGDSQILFGRVCSGDQFIADADKKQWLVETFDGACAEMEGAAVAHAAYVNGLPYLVMRGISDNADGSAGMSYEEFTKLAVVRITDLVRALLAKIPEEWIA